jgi:cysteine desulfurase
MAEGREVYLDYAAATPVAPEVLEEMIPYMSTCFYNPSAPYGPAREARRALEGARTRVSRVIGARTANVTFTAGATEANNLALASVEGLIVTSAIEHESVLEGVRSHAGGCALCPVDATGRVDMEELARLVRGDAELVSLALANGEIGCVQRIKQVARMCAEERMRRLEAHDMRPLLLHTDASQAAGAVSVNVSGLGVDLMTLSASKIYGPKQVGVLYHADGVALRPLVRGGGQEAGLRSGTENVAGACGMARALEVAEAMRASEVRRLRALSARLRTGLLDRVDDIRLPGPARDADRLPGLVHVSVAGVEARRLVVLLERRGVLVGTGSACAASKMRVSPTLVAIGLPERFRAGSLRLTMGRSTVEADVDLALDAICDVVAEERRRLA